MAPHLLFHLAIEMLEVEVFGDPDHPPDAAAQIAGEILGGTVRGVGIGGVVASEGVQEERVVLDGAGEGADVVQGP